MSYINYLDEMHTERLNQETCEHIYGFDNGYADESDPDYEKPELIYFELSCIDVIFKYCPKCGKKLKEDI